MADGLTQVKKRRLYSVCHEADCLTELLGELPGEVCVHKVVSFCEISVAGFVQFVAERTEIRRLSVSTFRVGPRALRMLNSLHTQGRLHDARFVVGKVMGNDRRKTSAIENYEALMNSCRRNGWQMASRANHTKLALFDTADGRFVLEGSSNFNEAPNWEQFSFEQDEELYDFYSAAIDEMFAAPEREGTPAISQGECAEEVLSWPEDGNQLSW